MESRGTKTVDLNEKQPSFSMGGIALIMLGAFLGAVGAALLMPSLAPGLVVSLTGDVPKAFWFLSRGSAFTAFFLLWLSMVMGVGITNKLSSHWPGLPPATEMHEFLSILGLAFGLFHGLIILGDQYIGFSLAQVLVPFASSNYKPLAVGFGQLGFYTMLIVTLSFYIRKKIGYKTWRVIHFLSFATYVMVLLHGVLAGTDAITQGAQLFYLITSGLLLFMILYRVLVSAAKSRERKLRMQSAPPEIPAL